MTTSITVHKVIAPKHIQMVILKLKSIINLHTNYKFLKEVRTDKRLKFENIIAALYSTYTLFMLKTFFYLMCYKQCALLFVLIEFI